MDRFIALQYHLRYATLVTNSRVICSIVAAWLIILISSGLRLWDKVVFYLLSAIFTGVCLAISTLCYLKIYQIVQRHRLHIRHQEQATKSHIIQNRTDKMRLKQSALNTFVFYIFMIACYFPAYIFLFLFGISYSTWKTEWTISSTVVFMNSSLNPILFCWRIRQLRVAAVKTARDMLCTTTD